MRRLSRRELLAAGTALLAGCSLSGDDPDVTATAAEVPSVAGRRTATTQGSCAPNCDRVPEPPLVRPPLGYNAIPPAAGALRPIADQHVYDRRGNTPTRTDDRRRTTPARTDALHGVVEDVAAVPDGLAVLVLETSDGDSLTPRLIRTGPDGGARSSRRLPDLPSVFTSVLEYLDGVTVFGGWRPDIDRYWLRGRRDDEVVLDYRTAPRNALVAVESSGGELLVGETRHAGPEKERPADAEVARLTTDGRVRWRRRLDGSGATTTAPPTATGPETRLTAMDTLADGVVVAGHDGDRIWVVALDGDGERRWRWTLPRGPQSLTVRGVGAGPTGVYLATAPGRAWRGRDHAIVVALNRAGILEWLRVLDPGQDPTAVTELTPVGVVEDDGPVVVGRVDGPSWYAASIEMSGLVDRAGYYDPPPTERERWTRVSRLQRAGGRLAVHGALVEPSGARDGDRRPWLALL